jgi:DNA modification methylase
MKIEQIDINELTPYAKNSRTHSPEQVAQIVASIKQFGFTNPVLIDKDNGIIAGHGRVLAGGKIGLEKIPCIRLGHLTEDQKRAYVLADNKLALNSGWDDELLRIELTELKTLGFDMDLTGFSADEIAVYTSDHTESNEAENEIPDTPVDPVSKLGDTWLLGPHRVRCGDSTNPADVEVLLQDTKPHLMVTDPPYGVEYDANWRNEADRANGKPYGARAIGKVQNDERADWTDAWKLFPGDVAYVWHAGVKAPEVARSLKRCGLVIRSQIIWSKNVFAIGRRDYHWKHEPCWYAVRDGGKSHWNKSRKETTVWDIDKPQKSETGHSTQKPVECMRRPILNNSKHGEIIYDPFLGSGTTVIAAETEGRVCYGMELSPAYVDVIVKRWQDFTGKKATHAESGEAFNG